MTKLDDLLETEPARTDVQGHWFCVQWIPDRASKERLNIGVGFVGSGGEKSYRLLSLFHRLECLYDQSVIFHARLACSIAQEAINRSDFRIGWSSSNIATVDRGFAQGDNADEIVNRLFAEAVPLARPEPQPERRDPFTPVPVEKAYGTIRHHLKMKLDLAFERHVPDDPYEEIEDNFGTERLYLPFRRNRAVATLASAAYADPMRVYHNLFEGFRFVDTARLRMNAEDAAIFFVLPGEGLQVDARERIEREIDNFYHFVQRHGLTVESHTELEALSDSVAEWCAPAAV